MSQAEQTTLRLRSPEDEAVERLHGQLAALHPPAQDYSDLLPLRVTRAYGLYWYWAAERMAMFYRRRDGAPAPWTSDPILQAYRFTLPYRALDRVSQYLIRHVIYDQTWSREDTFFRTALFRLFNRISTWELLQAEHGSLRCSSFDPGGFAGTLRRARRAGVKVFNPSYRRRTPSGAATVLDGVLSQLHTMLQDDLPRGLAELNIERAYSLLLTYSGMGPFITYQLVTDLAYSPHYGWNEGDFTVAGIGAKLGIAAVFAERAGRSEEDLIRLMAARQALEFKRHGLVFHPPGGLPLQLIDCQNIFCEIGKYTRVMRGGRAKQRYRPSPQPLPPVFLPPKWGINHNFYNPEVPHDNDNGQ